MRYKQASVTEGVTSILRCISARACVVCVRVCVCPVLEQVQTILLPPTADPELLVPLLELRLWPILCVCALPNKIAWYFPRLWLLPSSHGLAHLH